MKSQDHQLIALSHVLFRYKLTGELPNIDGKPFNLNDFQAKLFQGTGYQSDSDINININTLQTESNVTIVENQTIDCEHTDQIQNASDTTQSLDNNSNTNNTTVDGKKETEVGGQLFQYFNKDNNESL